MRNLNHAIVSGRLCADPELRSTPSGTSVCHLRVAVNDSVKDQATGEWSDRPNFLDVDYFGAGGENAAKYLEKGQAVVISGRLRWRSWEAQDGTKRSAVSIVADHVEFGQKAGQGGTGDKGLDSAKEFVREGQDAPSYQADDDDIPF